MVVMGVVEIPLLKKHGRKSFGKKGRQMKRDWAEDDSGLMERCPKCGRENHAMYVILNKCAWCGHNGNSDDGGVR